MHTMLSSIQGLGIPTESANAAATYLGQSSNGIGIQSDSYYADGIKTITELDAKYDDSILLRMTFKYLVTEVITALDHTDILKAEDLLKTAEDKASKFIKEQPYHFVVAEGEEKLDDNGEVKPKKGSKKVLAQKVYDEQIKGKELSRKEAIAILVEAGVSTPAGSSTYYAKLKKGEL